MPGWGVGHGTRALFAVRRTREAASRYLKGAVAGGRQSDAAARDEAPRSATGAHAPASVKALPG